MERKTIIALAAVGLLAVGGAVAWADESSTPKQADAAAAPTDAALARPQDPQAAHAGQQDRAPGHSEVAADRDKKMHEEMGSRAHQMGMEHGAQEMHEKMMGDRPMPQAMQGSGTQGGAPMKMGDTCSGSDCKPGDPSPAPMPMGHM